MFSFKRYVISARTPFNCQCQHVDSRENMCAFLSRQHLAKPHRFVRDRKKVRFIYSTVAGGCSSRRFNAGARIPPPVQGLQIGKSPFSTSSFVRWSLNYSRSDLMQLDIMTSSNTVDSLHGTDLLNLLFSLPDIPTNFTSVDFLAFTFVSAVLGIIAASIAYELKHFGSEKPSTLLLDDDDSKSQTRLPTVVGHSGSEGPQKWLNISKPSPFHRSVSARCPSLASSNDDQYLYRPTIIRKAKFGKPEYQRLCLQAHDGGTLALDWPSHLELEGNVELENILLFVCGTTEGSQEPGIGELSEVVEQHGYFPIILNPRGCGGSPLTTPRVFSAVDSDDVRLVVHFIAKSRPWATILGIGWGFGANMLLQYLGEEGSVTPFTAAVCIDNPFLQGEGSAPLSSSRGLEFDHAMTKGLVRIVESNKMLFQGEKKGFDVNGALNAISLYDFDQAISRVVHGYDTVEDFYSSTSNSASLRRVNIPLLCIQDMENYRGPLVSIPRQEFQQNAYTMLLVSLSDRKLPLNHHPGAASSWTHCISLEWLAAVEIALLKGRHPLLHDLNSILKLPNRWNTENQFSETIDPLSSRSSSALVSEDHVDVAVTEADEHNNSHYESSIAHVKEGEKQPTGVELSDAEEAEGGQVEGEEQPTGVELSDAEEAERGQVVQVAESVMKILDVTMPNTLSDDKKQEVLKAVGRGETLITALEGAVPEDVRATMSTAVSEALKAKDVTSKFGNRWPAPLLPGGVPGNLQSNLAKLTPTKEAPSADQGSSVNKGMDVQESNQDMTGIGAQTKLSGHDNTQNASENADARDNSSRDEGPTVRDKQEEKSASAESGQSQSNTKDEGIQPDNSDSIDGGSKSGVEKGKEKENLTPISSAKENPRQSVSKDSKNEGQPLTKDGGKESLHVQETDVATAEEKSGGSKPEGKDRNLPGPVDKAAEVNGEVSSSRAEDSQGKHDGGNSGKDAIGTSDSQGRETGREKKDKSLDATESKVDAIALPNQNNEPSPQAQAPDSGNPVSDQSPPPPSPSSDTDASAATPSQPPPNTQTPQTSPPPTAQSSPPPPQPPLPSVGQAWQAITGFDDSTQMAITNVFGVVENVLDQLEKENNSSSNATHGTDMASKQNSHGSDDRSYSSSQGNLGVSPESEQNGHDISNSEKDGSLDKSRRTTNNEAVTKSLNGGSRAQSFGKKSQGSRTFMQKRTSCGGASYLESPYSGANFVLDKSECGYIKVGINQGYRHSGHESKDDPKTVHDYSDPGSKSHAAVEVVDSSIPAENQNERRLNTVAAKIEAEDSVRAEDDRSEDSNTVAELVMNALKLEVVRRLGAAGLEALGVDLEQEVTKVAHAVAEAVTSSKGELLGELSYELQESTAEKKRVLSGNRIVTAIASVIGTNSLLGTLVPFGVLAGVVVAALGAFYLIVSDDQDEKSAQLNRSKAKKPDVKVPFLPKWSRSWADSKDDSHEIFEEAPLSDAPGHEEMTGGKYQDHSDMNVEDFSEKEEESQGKGVESKPPHEGKMMGAMAAAMGATAAFASQRQASTATDIHENQQSDSEIKTSGVSVIAEKAISMVAPVVPKTDAGEVDHDRLVSMLTDIGHKWGPLTFVGKAALLWGGLRGAMSLADRLLAFFRIRERPLQERLAGFLVVVILLWSPVLVPLLPTLLQQWTTKSPSGVADAAAGIGLYAANLILVIIWGRRVRGYDRPLVSYGLQLLSIAKLQAFAAGMAMGFGLVSGYYGINFILGYAQPTWSAFVVTSSALPGSLVATILTSWKALTLISQSFMMAVAVALVEEVLFRAWLYEEIAVNLGFDWAIILSALAFAVVHWSPPAMVGLWFLSVALAGARAKTGDLSLAIGIHTGIIFTFTIINLGGLVQFFPNAPTWFTGASAGNPLAGALGTGMVAILAMALYPARQKTSADDWDDDADGFSSDTDS